MCIPHGVSTVKSTPSVKKAKPKKSVAKVSKEQFEKGDPDFIDERSSKYKPEKKESFFDALLK